MMLFLYIIGLIFSYPAYLIYFKRKTYYVNKKLSNRHIKGGAILLSNHKGFKDFMLYIYAFPFRKLYCLMSEKVFGLNKFLNIFIKALGGIRVNRDKYEFSFINQSVELLDKNKLLLIFPEGKLPTTPYLQKFYPSYIIIALKSGKPIIPIYTPGGYSFFKRNKMVVGTPIYITDYIKNDNPTKEEIDNANEKIREEVLKLERFYRRKELENRYHKTFQIKRFFGDNGKVVLFFIRLLFPMKIHFMGNNKEKIKEKNDLILVSNHQGFLDPLLIMNLYWRRRMNMLVADIVFDGHRLRSFLLRQIGCIRINRDKPSLETLKRCSDILSVGGILSIFPEGHINKSDELAEFKSGAAYFSLKNNTKILPVYIVPNTKLFHRSHLYLGEYIIPKDKPTSENILKLDEEIRCELNRLKEVALK